VLYSGRDGLPRELVEQRQGVIPKCVGVVTQTCGCQSIKWLRRASRRGSDVCVGSFRARRTSLEGTLSPRAWRTSPEGTISPRARQTSPEGALSLAALVGHGGHQGCDRVVRAFWARGLVCIFYETRWVVPRLFRGPLGLSPTGGVSGFPTVENIFLIFMGPTVDMSNSQRKRERVDDEIPSA
jgi:hypothetical protein